MPSKQHKVWVVTWSDERPYVGTGDWLHVYETEEAGLRCFPREDLRPAILTIEEPPKRMEKT